MIDKTIQYDLLSKLEQETTRLRYATFTALISVSFSCPALPPPPSPATLAFLLGFLFYVFTVVHYAWYHRYAHRYRSALKKLEGELGIEIYRLRTRPRLGPMKFHFDWFLYILGLVYFGLTGSYVGWSLTLVVVGILVVLYAALLGWSALWTEEPME